MVNFKFIGYNFMPQAQYEEYCYFFLIVTTPTLPFIYIAELTWHLGDLI